MHFEQPVTSFVIYKITAFVWEKMLEISPFFTLEHFQNCAKIH